jgi:hypothetical protein
MDLGGETQPEEQAMFVGLLAALVVLVYLIYTLIRPEKF